MNPVTFILMHLNPIYWYYYFEKMYRLNKSGYNVIPSFDYYCNPHSYSVYKRNYWSPKTYTKYGKTYTYEEIIRKTEF